MAQTGWAGCRPTSITVVEVCKGPARSGPRSRAVEHILGRYEAEGSARARGSRQDERGRGRRGRRGPGRHARRGSGHSLGSGIGGAGGRRGARLGRRADPGPGFRRAGGAACRHPGRVARRGPGRGLCSAGDGRRGEESGRHRVRAPACRRLRPHLVAGLREQGAAWPAVRRARAPPRPCHPRCHAGGDAPRGYQRTPAASELASRLRQRHEPGDFPAMAPGRARSRPHHLLQGLLGRARHPCPGRASPAGRVRRPAPSTCSGGVSPVSPKGTPTHWPMRWATSR
jgi:hypothetical protein